MTGKSATGKTGAKNVAAANARLTGKLVLVTIAMFAFGFALIPLYDVFCQVTGINGKTQRSTAESVAAAPIDRDRWVTVEFTASTNSGMPWEFRPKQARMRVNPGEIATAVYYVHNTAGEAITGQAVPSVSPGLAAAHFTKIECFCFDKQELKAHETREMPVRFVVDSKLSPEVKTLTLSYTFFNVNAESAKKYGSFLPGQIAAQHQHDHM